jgi:hypothetical protein
VQESGSPAISRQGDGMNADDVAFSWFTLAFFVVWLLFTLMVIVVHYEYERCADNEKAGKENNNE